MKRNPNECYVYFAITGDFHLNEVLPLFDVQPFECWDKDDIRKADNKPFGFSLIKYNKIDEYDPYVDKMMEKCIAPFLDKVDLLNSLREKYTLEYYLTIVPSLVVDNINPCLAPSLKVMEFCVKTKTKIDCDLYLYKK